MDKIGWGQLGIVLIISRIFAEAANFPSDDINYGMQRFTVIILSYLLLAVMLIPVFLIVRGTDEKILGVTKNKLFALTLSAYLILAAISTMTRLQFYAASTIFNAAPPWLLIIFVSAVCLYGLLKGVSAVARTGVIIGGGFLLLLITVILGVFKDIRPEYLYPAITDNSKSLMGDILSELSKNAEAAVFAALFTAVRRDSIKSLFLYVSVSLSALILMTFLYNSVLGEYLDTTNFPFYTLSSLSDITVFQRLDGIDVVIWLMTAIIKLSLIINGIFVLIRNAFGKRKPALITAAAGLVTVSVFSLIFSVNTSDFLVFSSLMETGLPLIISVFVVPLLLLLFRRKEKKHNEAM